MPRRSGKGYISSRSPSPERYSRRRSRSPPRNGRYSRDSRSPSPYGRGRDRSRDRSRYSSRPRSRSRSFSPYQSYRESRRPGGRRQEYRDRSYSRSPVRKNEKDTRHHGREEEINDSAKAMAQSLENEFIATGFDEDQESMMKLMGFSGFNSTKGQAVEANSEGAVKVKSTRKARQYMNRKGGFNKPLPPERTGQKLNDM